MVPDALPSLKTRGGPRQAVNDEILPFDDRLVLSCLQLAAEPGTVTPTTALTDTLYYHSAGDDSQNDKVVVVSTHVRGGHNGTTPSPPSSSRTSTALNCTVEFGEDCTDYTSDVDLFEAGRAAEGPTESQPELDTLSSSLTLEDLLTAQRAGALCPTVVLRQSAVKYGPSFEDTDGLLRRNRPHDTGIVQVVVFGTLCPRL